jgi:hypothetical protein
LLLTWLRWPEAVDIHTDRQRVDDASEGLEFHSLGLRGDKHRGGPKQASEGPSDPPERMAGQRDNRNRSPAPEYLEQLCSHKCANSDRIEIDDRPWALTP